MGVVVGSGRTAGQVPVRLGGNPGPCRARWTLSGCKSSCAASPGWLGIRRPLVRIGVYNIEGIAVTRLLVRIRFVSRAEETMRVTLLINSQNYSVAVEVKSRSEVKHCVEPCAAGTYMRSTSFSLAYPSVYQEEENGLVEEAKRKCRARCGPSPYSCYFCSRRRICYWVRCFWQALKNTLAKVFDVGFDGQGYEVTPSFLKEGGFDGA